MPRRTLLLAAAASLALSGCSLKSESNSSQPPIGNGVKSSSQQAASELGFPVAATRDTTRVSGSDPVTDAAGVATALFPATSDATRPGAIALVDKGEWQAAIAASVLAGDPLHAPVLLSDGGSIPGATSGTLGRLKPRGEALSKGAQVILVGDRPPAPDGFKSGRVHGKDPFAIAAAVDNFQTAVTGRPTPDVMVVSAEQPGYAMPAAAWAARSGDPVLFVTRNAVPVATRRAIAQHSKPNIYLLGPPTVISSAVEAQLGKLGPVTRIQSKTPGPVASAADFARFKQNGFGWGADHPGRNFSLANVARPADVAGAATLGSNGVFAPLLVTDKADALPPALQGYFLDTQPGYENKDPSEAFYNRVWILGDKHAVSPDVQVKIDQVIQLVPVDTGPPTKPTAPAPPQTTPAPSKKPKH